MLSLRAALILIIAGGASSAYAEQITCESHNSQTEACGTLQPGGNVRMVQQLSNAPCVEGQNWGIRTSPNHDAIWVSGGCRAVFDVQPSYDNSTADRAVYDNGDNPQYTDTGHSPAWQRGFDDGERGMFDRRADSADYRDGYRAGKDAVHNENRYSETRNPPDAYRNEEPRRDDRADGTRYASGDSPRRIARSACIEQAASGQPFGPDQIRTGNVRWVGQGVLSVDVDTPDGPLICTVDRDGNVRSLDSH
ncbi:MAG TPA: DUF3011 domain-containing protein [Rudaea sp.]|nr:DUF3011 domain-containing protein [Rudaea sp.]